MAKRGAVATGLSVPSSLGFSTRGVHPERSRGRLSTSIPFRFVMHSLNIKDDHNNSNFFFASFFFVEM
jgi:hypothetical protein